LTDLIIEILFWIIKALFSKAERPPTARPENPRQVNNPQDALQQGRQDRPPSDQKVDEVWDAYRRKQEAMEAELRSKAPKW
jgi:hypothetical protein